MGSGGAMVEMGGGGREVGREGGGCTCTWGYLLDGWELDTPCQLQEQCNRS